MSPSATLEDRRIWRPQAKQVRFLVRDEHEALYGGAAFGGKSEALLMFSIRRREKYPGSAGLILRRTFADLNKEGALIPRSKEVLMGRAAWNDQYHRWTFPNGSVIQFGYLAHRDHRYQYQGTMWEDVCWDELTQFPSEEDYEFVNAFCRTDIDGCKPVVRAATNPGGPGHGWVKARFIEPAEWGETYTTPKGRTRVFIQALAEDNPIGLARNPEYLTNLESLPPVMARALRHGDWDIAEGMFFADVWRHRLHVIPQFTPPPDWARWVSIDYGYRNPFCALWHARSPDQKRVVTYRELYRTGWRAEEQAMHIRIASDQEHIRAYMADPSMFARRNETVGDSIADEYAKAAGIRLIPANNDRKSGWSVVRDAMSWEAHPKNEAIIRPPRWQVTANCVNLIRTVPSLPYDEIDKEDIDTDAEDHAADALRYGLMGERAPADTGRRSSLRRQEMAA